MLKSIIKQIIEKPIGKISTELCKILYNEFNRINKDDSWNNIVKNVVNATEDIDEEIGIHVFKAPSILNLKNKLINKEYDDIYNKFILTLAMELCLFDKEKLSISLGSAIIDEWLENNNILIDNVSYDIEALNKIINNREELYRSYFKLFDDKNGMDKIRIFYPKNGERWITWNEDYSIDINVNLSKRLEFGFCRAGFDYRKISCNRHKELKIAYIENGKEILNFESSTNYRGIIIWIR